ncbi:MAG: transcription antitermination factor NusB [Phycisphaerales bacterium]
MTDPRTIRRLAFQMLYQLDAVGGEGSEDMVRQLAGAEELSDGDRSRVAALALGAFAGRLAADDAVAELAPEWPVHRQPAVDRAILRLAHFEMVSGRVPAKAAIAEAVRLAREFSTAKSPAFVNAILDKLYKRMPTPAGPAEEPKAEEG